MRGNCIPGQCLVLCKLWESGCSLAWERAGAGSPEGADPLASRKTPAERQSRHGQMCTSTQYMQKEHAHTHHSKEIWVELII